MARVRQALLGQPDGESAHALPRITTRVTRAHRESDALRTSAREAARQAAHCHQLLWSRVSTLEDTLQELRRTMPLQMGLTIGTRGLGGVLATSLADNVLRGHRDNGRDA
jgi:hypothetical protein